MAEQIIEHVLLLNVREEEDKEDDSLPSRVNQMVNALNSLPLDHDSDFIYLTAGPILRIRSSYPDDSDADDLGLNLSHMVHARLRSQSGLDPYTDLVDQFVRPICDLIVNVDWAAAEGLDGPLVPKPGSALRLTLFNLNHKHDCEEAAAEDEVEGEAEVITKLLEGLHRMSNKWKSDSQKNPFHLEQISYGRSESVDMDDMSSETCYLGYNYKLIKVAALVVFPDLNELDACEEYEDEMRRLIRNHKIQPALHSLIHLDYVLPRPTLISPPPPPV